MWANRRERQKELRDKADFFEFTKNPVTAKWLRLLEKELGSQTPRHVLEQDFRDTLMAWELDFAGNNKLRRRRLASVSSIIFTAVDTGKLDKEIRIIMPIMRELGENLETLVPLGVAFEPFRRKRDFRMQFHGMCFHYQLYVEGVFDEAIRLLYLLTSSGKGKSASLEEINKMSLWKLRSEFQSLGLPDVFFEGWENGRVRNSIAHCRFRYDNNLGRMRFKDIDSTGRNPDYDRSFTLAEFSELGTKVSDVYLIIQNILFMLRIRQLVLSPFVPYVGKYLLMPGIRAALKSGMLAGPVG